MHLNETGLLENLEVMGDCLLAGPAACGNVTDRQSLVAYESEDVLTLGSSERCEDILGLHATMVPPKGQMHKL